MTRPRTLLSWSSGKDSAWTLHVLRQQAAYDVVGLVTTVNASAQRVAMHAVRTDLLAAQAAAAGLPLWPVPIPSPCSNAEYEAAMHILIERARAAGVTAFAFGDLFLEDIRAYRERQLADSGLTPVFPLWRSPTDGLAREMIAGGLRAYLTCVDPKQLHLAQRKDCLMVGNLQTGYIVVPYGAGIHAELEARCNQTRRVPSEWVRRFQLLTSASLLDDSVVS